jgi:pyruvate/2-oxoglutarate dehydrogenase complex dihydrolipoamide dehydrogenase (E3) component
MAAPLKADLCIIGAGAGGVAAAIAAAARGARVILIERSMTGGGRLNAGCVPARALMTAARRAHDRADPGPSGNGQVSPSPVDLQAVQAQIRGIVARLAPNDSIERLSGLGVRVIQGAARFVDMYTVGVGETEIQARRFVVATGSRPSVPLIPGLAGTPYLTNETIFDLTEVPRHLIVLGATAVGLPFAQAFRRFGADVTVVDQGTALEHEDAECTGAVLGQLEREGATIRTAANVTHVRSAAGKVELVLDNAGMTETIEGSHLLLATGRTPNMEGLALEGARIYFTDRGILTDKRMRTTGNKRVYAIGDVAGGPQFTHVATYHAGLVVGDALGRKRGRVSYRCVPRVIYTDPEIARVGLSEAVARRRRRPIRVRRWSYQDNDRAQAERTAYGHIKVITDPDGLILGVSIVGDRAGDLINVWTLALERNLKIDAMADLIVPYPTLSEIGKRAARTPMPHGLTRPLLQRIIDLLR